MLIENMALKNFNIEEHNNNNNNNIKFFKELFEKYNYNIQDNLYILESGNEYIFDNRRTYPQYTIESLEKQNNILFQTVLEKTCSKCLPSSFLDIGCGAGALPFCAWKAGCKRAVGIDIISNNLWNYFSNDTNGEVSFQQLDISKNKLSERFELITSFASFEHFLDPRGMLDAMGNLLEPNGVLYIRFSPLWFSTDGHHAYRKCHFPWFHLLFSDTVLKKFYTSVGINSKHTFVDSPIPFNRWSLSDFLFLFLNYRTLTAINFRLIYNLRHYWFLHNFSQLLPYSNADLLTCGIEIVFQKRDK